MGTIVDLYNYMIVNGDPRIKDWPMMSSPMPTLILTACYLYFVKIAGPRWMQHKKPYNLRNLMICYNFSLVALCSWMFFEMGHLGQWGSYSFKCKPVDYLMDVVSVRMCYLGWLFLMTKYIEFADTIFFVLRKKNNQISTLHVFHHSVVPISVWIGLKFYCGGANTLFPFLNTGVHCVMYLYYGLAALGPLMQKYLWWKKYLTTLQMAQFALIMILDLHIVITGCAFPKSFLFLNLFHAILFFYIFLTFCRKSYKAEFTVREKSSVAQQLLLG